MGKNLFRDLYPLGADFRRLVAGRGVHARATAGANAANIESAMLGLQTRSAPQFYASLDARASSTHDPNAVISPAEIPHCSEPLT
jgi:hypothetical protein